MDPTGTRYLVVDYINYRLNNNGVQWGQCPSLLPQPLEVHQTLRKKGDEFEERFQNEFQYLIDELHIRESTAYPMFCKVVEEIFNGGINWGRIIALFSFGGSLATQCMKRDMPQLIDSIIEWITLYIDKTWIHAHGGWSSFRTDMNLLAGQLYTIGPKIEDDHMSGNTSDEDLLIQNDAKNLPTVTGRETEYQDGGNNNRQLNEENEPKLEILRDENGTLWDVNSQEESSGHEIFTAADTTDEIGFSLTDDDKPGDIVEEKIISAVENKDKTNFSRCEFDDSEAIIRQSDSSGKTWQIDGDKYSRKLNSRLKPPQHVYKSTLLLMSIFICCSEGNIDASLPLFPLKFGSNVTLTCSCNDSGTNVMVWIKGDNKMQLAIGNKSTNNHKYLPSIDYEDSIYVYSLTIQTFDMTDIDVYHCQFDFEVSNILLKRDLFIYLPSADEIEIILENDLDTLNISVNIDDIFPQADCNIKFKGVDISNQSSSTTLSKNGFYKVNLKTAIPIQQECTGIFEIACEINNQSFSVLSHRFEECALSVTKGNTTDVETTVLSILAGISFCVILVVFGIYCYKKKTMKDKRKCQRSSVEECVHLQKNNN